MQHGTTMKMIKCSSILNIRWGVSCPLHEGVQEELHSIINFRSRWNWLVRFMPRPLYPEGKIPLRNAFPSVSVLFPQFLWFPSVFPFFFLNFRAFPQFSVRFPQFPPFFLSFPCFPSVFPCFFLSCKANARVKLAKTGHGTLPH